MLKLVLFIRIVILLYVHCKRCLNIVNKIKSKNSHLYLLKTYLLIMIKHNEKKKCESKFIFQLQFLPQSCCLTNSNNNNNVSF